MVKITGDDQIARVADKTHDPEIVFKSIQFNRETVDGNNAMSMQVVIKEALNTFIMSIQMAEWPVTAVRGYA